MLTPAGARRTDMIGRTVRRIRTERGMSLRTLAAAQSPDGTLTAARRLRDLTTRPDHP